MFRVRDSLGIGQGETHACKVHAKDQKNPRRIWCPFTVVLSIKHRFLSFKQSVWVCEPVCSVARISDELDQPDEDADQDSGHDMSYPYF